MQSTTDTARQIMQLVGRFGIAFARARALGGDCRHGTRVGLFVRQKQQQQRRRR